MAGFCLHAVVVFPAPPEKFAVRKFRDDDSGRDGCSVVKPRPRRKFDDAFGGDSEISGVKQGVNIGPHRKSIGDGILTVILERLDVRGFENFRHRNVCNDTPLASRQHVPPKCRLIGTRDSTGLHTFAFDFIGQFLQLLFVQRIQNVGLIDARSKQLLDLRFQIRAEVVMLTCPVTTGFSFEIAVVGEKEQIFSCNAKIVCTFRAIRPIRKGKGTLTIPMDKIEIVLQFRMTAGEGDDDSRKLVYGDVSFATFEKGAADLEQEPQRIKDQPVPNP